MSIRAPFTLFIVLLSVTTSACLRGEISVVDTYEKQEKNLSQKRFEQKFWSGNQKSDLMQKSFPFKQWDSHYSSLGSKKSNISLTESKDKKRFKSEIVEFDTKTMDISKWDGRMAELERQAQISTNSTLKEIENKRMYTRMLQESKSFAETGETLSLRDINRFQFRKNRSDTAVPVRAAGGGDDS
jgi:hypothetical protein